MTSTDWSTILANVLSPKNLEEIYNRFDPLREEMSKDPAFLDELATVKNPLQNIVQLKDNDIRFRWEPNHRLNQYWMLRSSNRVMKAKNRQERYKKGYILLEGKRLIADAIQAGADLLTLFVTDRQLLDVNISAFSGWSSVNARTRSFSSLVYWFLSDRSELQCISNISCRLSHMVGCSNKSRCNGYDIAFSESKPNKRQCCSL